MAELDLERVRMNWRYAEKHAFVYPQLIAAIPDLLVEIDRLEGDLAVAVHEATTARAAVQRVREALRTRETELHEAIPPSLRSSAIASGSVKVTTGEIYAALAAPVQPEETQQ